jgi:hypothetical protein
LAFWFWDSSSGCVSPLDPDHVIAVSTIVTRQGGIAKAGLIGALWGLGHYHGHSWRVDHFV